MDPACICYISFVVHPAWLVLAVFKVLTGFEIDGVEASCYLRIWQEGGRK